MCVKKLFISAIIFSTVDLFSMNVERMLSEATSDTQKVEILSQALAKKSDEVSTLQDKVSSLEQALEDTLCVAISYICSQSGAVFVKGAFNDFLDEAHILTYATALEAGGWARVKARAETSAEFPVPADVLPTPERLSDAAAASEARQAAWLAGRAHALP